MPSQKYIYRIKTLNQLVQLTPRQDECFWSYYHYRNIKLVALHIGISTRTIEEHLNLARKKFQIGKLKLLMGAVDNLLIECVDKNNSLTRRNRQ